MEVRGRLEAVEAENQILKLKIENKRLKINPPKEFRGDRCQTKIFLF